MTLLPLLFSLAIGSFDTPDLAPPPPGPLTRVHHDHMDGVSYALGQTYKMTFDERGARYFPRLGPRAEKNLPLHFAFPDAPLAITQNGDRIVLARESFTEIYDLGTEIVEQSFLFEWRPHDGDLNKSPRFAYAASPSEERAGEENRRCDSMERVAEEIRRCMRVSQPGVAIMESWTLI